MSDLKDFELNENEKEEILKSLGEAIQGEPTPIDVGDPKWLPGDGKAPDIQGGYGVKPDPFAKFRKYSQGAAKPEAKKPVRDSANIFPKEPNLEEKALLIFHTNKRKKKTKIHALIDDKGIYLRDLNRVVNNVTFHDNKLYDCVIIEDPKKSFGGFDVDYIRYHSKVYETLDNRLISEFKDTSAGIISHNGVMYCLLENWDYPKNFWLGIESTVKEIILIDLFSKREISQIKKSDKLHSWFKYNDRLYYNNGNVIYDLFSNQKIVEVGTKKLFALFSHNGNNYIMVEKYNLLGGYYNTDIYQFDEISDLRNLSYTKKIGTYYNLYLIGSYQDDILYARRVSAKIFSVFNKDKIISFKDLENNDRIVSLFGVPKSFVEKNLM